MVKLRFIVLLLAMFVYFTGEAQTTKKNPDGTYTMVYKNKSKSVDKPVSTLDIKGVIYIIYKSPNDKYYIWRESRKGVKYKQYVKL